MSLPVITFPPPPPTSNNLTSQQRQQLLRSTRKLTKLLGSAPHLTDQCDTPLQAVYLNLSSKLQFISNTPTPSQLSYDIPRPPSPASSISSVSTTSKAHHKTRTHSRSNSRESQDYTFDSPFSKKQPPILRLSSFGDEFPPLTWSTTKQDNVPDSPPTVATDTDSCQVSDTSDGDFGDPLLSPISPSIAPIPASVRRSYTLPVPRRRAMSSPFVETPEPTFEPTFKVTSEASTRRLKMERIRKRLGECVPVEEVFHRESPDGEDEDGDYVRVTPVKEPTQINVDVRPRWKASPAVLAFDVIYECPSEHGDEGLANGLGLSSKTPKGSSSTSTSPKRSNTAPLRYSGKLVKRQSRVSRF